MSAHPQPVSPPSALHPSQVRELLMSPPSPHATEAPKGHPPQEAAKKAQTPVEKQHYEISQDLMERAIDDANRLVMNSESQLQFSLHHGDNMVTVRLTDKSGGGVVREVSSEHFLTMLEAMRKLAGMNVDVTR
ncbi:MAG TPA: flagellar protein FlaG [Oscillatoriaceae cyanobacterium]